MKAWPFFFVGLMWIVIVNFLKLPMPELLAIFGLIIMLYSVVFSIHIEAPSQRKRGQER